MITRRLAADRGRTRIGWLDSRHSFSFGDYHDPDHSHFRALRVLNEDRVRPGAGFGTHLHRDMEIVTYVLAGALEHRDSTGSTAAVRPGVVQRLSAGTGITHSERNASRSEPVHFLQLWIQPETAGLTPSYEERAFDLADGDLHLLAAPGAPRGALDVHQDVALYAARLRSGDTVEHRLEPGRHAWIQVARGAIEANGDVLAAGDGAAVSRETHLTLTATHAAELLVGDLA